MIECVHVLGWQCVANKGEFQVGDKCVYMEVDSFLPVCDEFEFLRLTSPEWYVFTMIDLDTHERLPLARMQELCALLELDMVPVEEVKDDFAYSSVEELLERARADTPPELPRKAS